MCCHSLAAGFGEGEGGCGPQTVFGASLSLSLTSAQPSVARRAQTQAQESLREARRLRQPPSWQNNKSFGVVKVVGFRASARPRFGFPFIGPGGSRRVKTTTLNTFIFQCLWPESDQFGRQNALASCVAIFRSSGGFWCQNPAEACSGACRGCAFRRRDPFGGRNPAHLHRRHTQFGNRVESDRAGTGCRHFSEA